MKKVFFLLVIILFFSCETEEQKKEKAQEVVKALIANMKLENYESSLEYYPGLIKGVGNYRQFNSVNFTSTMIKPDGSIEIFAKSNSNRQLFFTLQNIDGTYKITNSKGLSNYYDSNLYNYCKNIGCFGMSNFDIDVARICKDKDAEFRRLVNSIKYKIESQTRLENQTLTKNGGYGMPYYVTGNITIKNHSRFTIPGYSYKLYVNYLDANDNILFTSEESLGNFQAIGFNQSKTIHVMQNSSSKFRKVSVKVKLLNTEFIEKGITEYAKGSNCNYSDNL